MASPVSDNVEEIALIVGTTTMAKPPSIDGAAASGRRRTAAKSKKEQLVGLIAKPAGTRISVLCERLGWQAHTVRAALSGLRKRGHVILATKAPKTGEAVYTLAIASKRYR